MKLIGISGSLRKQSYNSSLLRLCAELIQGATIEIASIQEIPLYNADDEEAHGVPAAVRHLQDRITQADALIIASPEYNHGIPGVLKNTIDWLTRPDGVIPKVFAGKPLAMLGASPSGFGTINAQTSWLSTWRLLQVRLWHEQLPFMISRAHTIFDASGKISDDATKERLAKYLDGYVKFISSTRLS